MSISGISSSTSSSAWAGIDSTTASTRGAERRERMFAKADRNGDGSVDSAELQGVLDKMAQKTGGTAANADDVLKTMDSDGNGMLSADELDAGMKSLQPAATSTMDFAQRRGGDEVHGHDGPPPEGPGDGTQGNDGATGSADGLQSLLTNLFQAADTDGNGSLNSSELDTLKTNLDTAIQSLVGTADSGAAATTTTTGSTGTSSSGTASTSTDSSSADAGSSSTASTAPRDPMATLSALAELVLKEYAATAASSTAAQASTAAVNLSA